MHILVISTDPRIFDTESAVAKRHVAYASSGVRISILARGGGGVVQLAENVTVYPTSSSKLWWGIRALKHRHELGDIDIVSSQDPFEIGLLGVLLAKRYHAALHVQLHTDPFSEHFGFTLKNKLRKALMPFVLRRANCVRVVSERLKKGVASMTDAPISVLPIFVDSSRFSRAERGEKRVLVVSRLEPEKDVARALFIFARFLKEIPDATLAIAGGGSQRERLERLAQTLGITETVSFLGNVVENETLYRNYDALLHTARFEGYGLALEEARIAGLSVVSTDVGIAREIGAHVFSSDAEAVKHLTKALHEAAPMYTPRYGDFETYLQDWREQFNACV